MLDTPLRGIKDRPRCKPNGDARGLIRVEWHGEEGLGTRADMLCGTSDLAMGSVPIRLMTFT